MFFILEMHPSNAIFFSIFPPHQLGHANYLFNIKITMSNGYIWSNENKGVKVLKENDRQTWYAIVVLTQHVIDEIFGK